LIFFFRNWGGWGKMLVCLLLLMPSIKDYYNTKTTPPAQYDRLDARCER
jgi:hypothetical protein